MPDPTRGYANKYDLWINITHLPSGKSVKYKAMLKNFSDNFESNWNSEEVYGRMDPIETFQGTKRVIQIEWDVVAYDHYEAESNLHKADLLSTFLYPVYSDFGNSNSITTAPLLRMKFSNLMSSVNNEGLIGRLAGFQYTPDLDSGVFYGKRNIICPQAMTINATFHVLHDYSLGWNSSRERREKRLPHGGPARATEERSKTVQDFEDELNRMAGPMAERRRDTGAHLGHPRRSDSGRAPVAGLRDPYRAEEFARFRKMLKNTKIPVD